MRTTLTVAVSALIAVAALVAAAGPARTEAPGTIGPVDRRAFAPLVLPPVQTTTVPGSDTAMGGDGPARADAPIRDPGLPPLPTGRTAMPLPGVVVAPVAKPTPRPVAPATWAAGGGWLRAEYSWYGTGFYGSGTACGQTYSRTILGVAHRTLPCGTKVTFRNPKNGRTITVPVIDRGPYVAGRTWDLSAATCSYLGNCYTGTIQYRLP